jgi:hypothetical protein
MYFCISFIRIASRHPARVRVGKPERIADCHSLCRESLNFSRFFLTLLSPLIRTHGVRWEEGRRPNGENRGSTYASPRYAPLRLLVWSESITFDAAGRLIIVVGKGTEPMRVETIRESGHGVWVVAFIPSASSGHHQQHRVEQSFLNLKPAGGRGR